MSVTLTLRAAAMMMSTSYFQFSEANFAKDQKGPFWNPDTVNKAFRQLSKSLLSRHLQQMPKTELLITGPTLGITQESYISFVKST